MTTKQMIQVETTGEWTSGVQTAITIRSFDRLIVDEPISLGGANEGPNPVELLLAGLSSCTSVMIAIIAKEQNFSYTAAEFFNSGELDLRGLMGVEGVSAHFQSVQFDVVLTTDETEERIEQLKQQVEKRCPVMNLLLDAKVPVQSSWSKK